jgi:BASS family bile acid:Na+ symporter
MVSVALEATHSEIMDALRDTRRMGRSLLANFVIVPIVGFVLVRALGLRPEVRIGVMMLAFSPGGLFALQFARISKGNRVFAVALLIVLVVLAVFISPLLLIGLFSKVATAEGVFRELVVLFLLLVALPLFIGRGLQRLMPDIALKLGQLLGTLSIVIFIIVALASSKHKRLAIEAIGLDGIVAMVLLTIAS